MNRTTTGFFGLQPTGQRVAFILDMSGSMEGARWQACSRALAQTLQTLHSDATFFVVLYSTELAEPPGQSGWRPATFTDIAATLEWIARTHPSGGTNPRPAFERVFALAERPSCILFLTDGQFSGFDAAVCSQLQGERTTSRGSFWKSLASLWPGTRASPTINTVTLDDDASAPVLREIAAQSGGKYVHASST
jgi:Mg-chelatase subunit ChlD